MLKHLTHTKVGNSESHNNLWVILYTTCCSFWIQLWWVCQLLKHKWVMLYRPIKQYSLLLEFCWHSFMENLLVVAFKITLIVLNTVQYHRTGKILIKDTVSGLCLLGLFGYLRGLLTYHCNLIKLFWLTMQWVFWLLMEKSRVILLAKKMNFILW